MVSRHSASDNDSSIEITQIPRYARGFSTGVLQNLIANILALAIAWLWAQSLGLLKANTPTTRVATGIVCVAVAFALVTLVIDRLEERLTYRGRPVKKAVTRIIMCLVSVLIAASVALGAFSWDRTIQFATIIPIRFAESLLALAPGILAVSVVYLGGNWWMDRMWAREKAAIDALDAYPLEFTLKRLDQRIDLISKLADLSARRYKIYDRAFAVTFWSGALVWVGAFIYLTLTSQDPLTTLNFIRKS